MQAREPVREQLLFVNSRNRDSGEPQDMTISMRNGLLQAGDSEIICLELCSFQMYRLFPNVVQGYNSQFRILWDSEHSDGTAASKHTVTSQVYTIPEGQYTASTLAFALQSLLQYNPAPIETGKNDQFVVRDTAQGGVRQVTVTLPAGTLSPTQVASAVTAQLNAAIVGNPYTCTYAAPFKGYGSGGYTIAVKAGTTWKFRVDFSGSRSAYLVMGADQTTYGGATDAAMAFTDGAPWTSALPPLVNGNPMGVSYNATVNRITFSPPANAYGAQLIFNDTELNQPMAGELLGFQAGSYSPYFTSPTTSVVPLNVNSYDNILLATNLACQGNCATMDNFSAIPLQDGGSSGGSINAPQFQPNNPAGGFKTSNVMAMIPVDAPANQLIIHDFPRNMFRIMLADATIPFIRFQLLNEFGTPMPLDNCEWTATFKVQFMRAKSADNDEVVSALETIKGLIKLGITALARR